MPTQGPLPAHDDYGFDVKCLGLPACECLSGPLILVTMHMSGEGMKKITKHYSHNVTKQLQIYSAAILTHWPLGDVAVILKV